MCKKDLGCKYFILYQYISRKHNGCCFSHFSPFLKNSPVDGKYWNSADIPLTVEFTPDRDFCIPQMKGALLQINSCMQSVFSSSDLSLMYSTMSFGSSGFVIYDILDFTSGFSTTHSNGEPLGRFFTSDVKNGLDLASDFPIWNFKCVEDFNIFFLVYQTKESTENMVSL